MQISETMEVAVVTGGATGIGKKVAELLASQGAVSVIVYSKNEAQAHLTVTEIQSQGGQAVAYNCDISKESEVRETFNAIGERFGRIDFLVNNAGATKQLDFADLSAVTEDVWNELFAVNVKGAFNCCKYSLPWLRNEGRRGSVLNVGSIAGHTGYGSSLPYAVTKSAMHGLTKSLAKALAPKIRVNCVAPGAVETKWWRGYEEKLRTLTGNVALNRISTPEDMATLIVAILKSPSMTGQIILAENGQTL